MNFTRFYICGVISLLWWINEALSTRVYENTNSENHTIQLDTKPTQNILSVVPAPVKEITDDVLNTTESVVKAKILVADNQKSNSLLGVVENTPKLSSVLIQNDQLPDKKSAKILRTGTQQKWQIPSPLSLQSSLDSKTTNSSKRQILENFQKSKEFIPSLQVGSFDDTQGFVPHSLTKEKNIQNVQIVYGTHKVVKNDARQNNRGEQRSSINRFSDVRSQSNENFESDFIDNANDRPNLQSYGGNGHQNIQSFGGNGQQNLQTYGENNQQNLQSYGGNGQQNFPLNNGNYQPNVQFSHVSGQQNSLFNSGNSQPNFQVNNVNGQQNLQFKDQSDGISLSNYGEPRFPINKGFDDSRISLNSYGEPTNANGFGAIKSSGLFDDSRLPLTGFTESKLPNNDSGDGPRTPLADLSNKQIPTNLNGETKFPLGNFDESSLPIKDPSEYRHLNSRHGLEAFQNDFDILKNKYPELNELVSNYPLMEEIMHQKLAEKFQQPLHSHRPLPAPENIFDNINPGDNIGERLKLHDQSNVHPSNFKFPDSSEDTKSHGPYLSQLIKGPFQFDNVKPNWYSRKKPGKDDDNVSMEVPAGEIYQGSKFPDTPYPHDDKKSYEGGDSMKPVHVEHHTKISPWKRVLHMLTAFIPVGILISALTPNVVNINNTADKNYPFRQRSVNQLSPMTSNFLEVVQGSLLESDAIHSSQGAEEPGCNDRTFCEVARSGKDAKAMTTEKIFWDLAHATPDLISEKAGMKKLFKAIKSGDCHQFICKKPRRIAASSERIPIVIGQEPSADIEILKIEEDIAEPREDEVYDEVTTTSTTKSPRIRKGIFRRGKRTHD